MKECSYLSRQWLPVETILNSWVSLFPKVKKRPLLPSYYTINSKNPLPAIVSSIMECKQFNLVGKYLDPDNWFSHFIKILEKGREFENIDRDIGFRMDYSFVENGIKNKIRNSTSIGIWLGGNKLSISIYFGDFSRFKDPKIFENFLNEINHSTNLKPNLAIRLHPQSPSFSIPIPNEISVSELKIVFLELIKIIGVGKFLKADWELWGRFMNGCCWTGLQCYNRGIELEIPAESYDMEIVSYCPTFESLEEIRPLFGPTNYSAHILGEMRFEKRIKMTFRLFFGALGYRLMLTTNHPLHGPDGDPLTSEMRARLAAAELDLETCYAYKALFKNGPAT